jgi:hypothetical protein
VQQLAAAQRSNREMQQKKEKEKQPVPKFDVNTSPFVDLVEDDSHQRIDLESYLRSNVPRQVRRNEFESEITLLWDRAESRVGSVFEPSNAVFKHR